MQLVQLFLCIPVSIAIDAGTISGLLQKLRYIYSSHRDEQLLNGIAMAFRHFAQCENEAIKKETDLVVHELFDEIIEKLSSALQVDEKYMAGIGTTETKKNTKKQRRKILDMEHSLVVSMTRFCCLFKYINAHVHATLDTSQLDSSTNTDSTELVDRVDQVVRDLCKLVARRTVQIVALEGPMRDASCIKHVLMTLYLNLLWLSRPVFNTLSTMDEHQISASSDSHSQYLIKRIQHARTILEEALISVLQMHLEKNSLASTISPNGNDAVDCLDPTEITMDGDIGVYVRDSQAIAFQVYCDVRCLLVEKFQDLPEPYATLEWVLPKLLVLLSQMCFENLMEADEPDKEDEVIVASDEGGLGSSKADVLISLGKASICNPGSKRQAAAILRYLTGSDDKSLEAVKAFCKYFRNNTPIRFLEIQMTALRQLFTTLLIMQDELKQQESGQEEDVEDLQANIIALDQELKDLSKKLSQSLGVGKIAPSLTASFFRFLCEGIRYALEDHRNFGFLECLRPYLVHLDRQTRTQLGNYFTQLLERAQDIPEDESAFDSHWRILLNFRSLLNESANKIGKASSRHLRSPLLKRKSRSKTNALNEGVGEEQSNGRASVDKDNLSSNKRTSLDAEISVTVNDTLDSKRRRIDSQSSHDDDMIRSPQAEDSENAAAGESDTESVGLMQPTQITESEVKDVDSNATSPIQMVDKRLTQQSMHLSNAKDLHNSERTASPTSSLGAIAQADSEDEIDSRRVRRRR